MKIVAIKDMSAGNAEVGDMWQETKIFDDSTPISKVVEWGLGERYVPMDHLILKKRLTLTIPEGDK